MTIIRLPIVRWVRSDNPGWVECLLTDASGRTWSLIDKLPIFSQQVDLDETSLYPQPGVLACEVIGEKVDNEGRTVWVIDSGRPWGVESTDGTRHFEVFQEQVETIHP